MMKATDTSFPNYEHSMQIEYGVTGLTNEQVREASYKMFVFWCKKHELQPFSRRWADQQGYDSSTHGYTPENPNLTWEDVDMHYVNLVNGYKRNPNPGNPQTK